MARNHPKTVNTWQVMADGGREWQTLADNGSRGQWLATLRWTSPAPACFDSRSNWCCDLVITRPSKKNNRPHTSTARRSKGVAGCSGPQTAISAAANKPVLPASVKMLISTKERPKRGLQSSLFTLYFCEVKPYPISMPRRVIACLNMGGLGCHDLGA